VEWPGQPRHGGPPTPTAAVPDLSTTRGVVAGGFHGWEIAVVVAIVAVLSAMVSVVVDRAIAARRKGVVPAA